MKKMISYKLKGKKVFIGIDVSKRKYSLNVRSENMMIEQLNLPADYEVFGNYLENNYPKCDISLIYEAGFSGFGLHDYVTDLGMTCIVTPPTSVLEEKVEKKKCDKHDASRLAINLEKGYYKSCDVPDKERREDRIITRYIEQLQADLTREKNRIRRLFDYYDLNGNNTSERWFASDWRAARELSQREGPVGECLRMHFEHLDLLLKLRRESRKTLFAIGKKERYRKAVEILSGMPGVGLFSAIRLVLEWGEDWSRFTTSAKIASYSGLISSEYSTGDTVHRGHITGQCREVIRALLIQCAWVAIRQDPVLREKYQRVWKNSGSNKKAIVAVARKMVVRMRAIMLSGKEYEIGLVEERQEKKQGNANKTALRK
jgi:transposase